MSNKNHPSKRRSAPTSTAVSGTQHAPVMPPLPYWNHTFNPYMYPASQGPSGSSTAAPSKPWEMTSSSSEDDDFISKKKRKATKTPAAEAGQPKRGPGRPRKSPAEEKTSSYKSKILDNYPGTILDQDTYTFVEREECPSCHSNKGRVAFVPCGHALYCYSCVNKLRKEAVNMGRPAKCTVEDCYTIVTKWIKMYNVSA